MNLLSDFKKTFADDLSDFTKELAETTLDSVIDNPILQNIPVVQGFIAFYKLGIGIRERHNIKKILKFLNSLASISSEEKQAFIVRLSSEGAEEEIFEKLLIILDRLDDAEKALIVGNLFKLYVLDIIPQNKFLRLSSIIEKCFLSDILFLHQMHDQKEMKGFDPESHTGFNKYETKMSLYNFGLLEQKIKIKELREDIYRDKFEHQIKYQVTSLGKLLATCIYFDDDQLAKVKESIKYYING